MSVGSIPYCPSRRAHASPAAPCSQQPQRVQVLPQQGYDHARQHVAAAAHRHAGIAGGVYVFPFPVGDAAAVALEHHDAAQKRGSRFGVRHRVVGAGDTQPGKLSRMGRENGRPGPSAQ